MTAQTIYDPVVSARILESLTFLISEIPYVISQNSSKSLCQKTIMLKKKIESPFQTRYNCDWIKFPCYSSDKLFRKIGEVNIWRGKSEIISEKKPLIKALLHFHTAFFTLIIPVQNSILTTLTLLSNLGQVSALKVAYILKVFSAQSSLMVAS